MSDDKPARTGMRNVVLLGVVSFFTDLSSEMIYPLVPAFLEGLGASKSVIGLIEGIAESTAALLRTVFGRLSDRAGKRKAFIFSGYALSAVSKPFLYLAGAWPVVLAVRFADRVGKAVRSPARDALISISVSEERKGTAFGLQRAMDSLGAVGGPFLALFVLHLFRSRPEMDRYRWVFILSFVPAVLALAFIPFAREAAAQTKPKAGERASGLRSPAFLVFLAAAVVFTLGNSSNAFLILRAKEVGLPIAMIPLIWALYNAVGAVSSSIFGALSDRVGRTPMIVTSFLYYAVVYVLFGVAAQLWAMWALFAAYGVHYGLSEGVFRAHIADLVEPEQRATAYGLFNTGVGLALIPASLIFGAVWDAFGSRAAFFMGAGFSLLGFVIFVASTKMTMTNDK